MPQTDQNPSKEPYFKKGECVICHTTVGVRGFFCPEHSVMPEISDPHTPAVNQDLWRVYDLKQGESAYVSLGAFFVAEKSLWIIRDYPIFEGRTSTQLINISRGENNVIVVLNYEEIDFSKVADYWPPIIGVDEAEVCYEYTEDDSLSFDVVNDDDNYEAQTYPITEVQDYETFYIKSESVVTVWAQYYICADSIVSTQFSDEYDVEVTRIGINLVINGNSLTLSKIRHDFPNDGRKFIQAKIE